MSNINYYEKQRIDGKWYIAEGDDTYGFITLLNKKKSFEDKVGYRFPNVEAAGAVCKLLGDAFDKGYKQKEQDIY